MTLGALLLTLIIVGVALYLVGFIPMDATIKKIITVVVILAVVIWLAEAFGLLGLGHTLRVR